MNNHPFVRGMSIGTIAFPIMLVTITGFSYLDQYFLGSIVASSFILFITVTMLVMALSVGLSNWILSVEGRKNDLKVKNVQKVIKGNAVNIVSKSD